MALWSAGGAYTVASRKADYFWGELALNNGSAALYPIVTNVAALPGSPDVVSSLTRTNFLAQSPENFGYDLDGNLTTDGRWSYTWDAENRLVSLVARTAVGPQQLLKFEYDWQGRRIGKKVWNNTAGSGNPALNLKYLYDGWDVVADLDGANNNALVRSYVWGTDLSGTWQGAGGVGGLLKLTYAGAQTTNCFAAFDGSGNVMGLVDAANGSVIAQYEYGPFGEVIRATGPMAQVIRSDGAPNTKTMKRTW